LKSGTSLRRILASVSHVRSLTQIPIVLMAYYNTIHSFGAADFCRDAVKAGVDGLIVPDMPPDEAGPLQGPAREAGLDLIFLLAPTSTAARRRLVAKQSEGFLYYVSLTGITGAKLRDVTDVGNNVKKIRQQVRVSIAVGFGVATPEDAALVAGVADGVIVGTALVRVIHQYAQDPRMVEQAGAFARSLKIAMQPASVLRVPG
jgi:tryptophan synthase alpha chain